MVDLLPDSYKIYKHEHDYWPWLGISANFWIYRTGNNLRREFRWLPTTTITPSACEGLGAMAMVNPSVLTSMDPTANRQRPFAMYIFHLNRPQEARNSLDATEISG